MTLKDFAKKIYPMFIKNFQPDSDCKLFLSASDMKTRAIVKNASGNSPDEVWKIALEDLEKNLKSAGIKPKIFRADWVVSSEKMTWENFIKLLGKTRRNYFRRGLALDADYKISFTEQELNANSMLYKDGKEGSAKCFFRKDRSDEYCQKRFSCDFPMPELTQMVEIFETDAAFVQEDEEPKIITGRGIYSGYRDTSCLDPEIFMACAKKGVNHLVKQVTKTGRFVYGLYPCFDKIVPSYNTVRHFSSISSMLDVYRTYKKMPPMRLGKAIISAMDYGVKKFICYRKLDNGTEVAYVQEVNGEIKLGANGIGLVALANYCELMHTKKYLPLMRLLARGIVTMQKEDGSFIHVLNSKDFSVKEPFRIVYYDGEAVFGLMKLYALTKEEEFLQIAEKAFSRFVETNHWRNHDHWLSYAVNEFTRWKPERKYFEFGINNFLAFLPFIYHRDTQYPTLLELMMAADTMLERIKTMPEFADLLEKVNFDDFYAAMEKRAQNLLNGYFWPEMAMYFANPESIAGSFFIRHHAFRARIDDVQHFLSGFVLYAKYLERRKNLPDPVPSQQLLNSTAEGDGIFNIQSTDKKALSSPSVDEKAIELPLVQKKIPEITPLEKKESPQEKNYPTMKGITETMLEVFKILGIEQPENKNFQAPSDYLGEDFSLTESMQEDLCSRKNLSKEAFVKMWEGFKNYYVSQKPLKQTQTDLTIFFCDWLLFSERYGFDIVDYFDFEFYNKSLKIQRTFIGGVNRRKHNRVGNDRFSVRYMYNKKLTNRTFSEFIHRDWIDARTSSLENFKIFVAKHPVFFAKNNVGGGGKGARIIKTDENSNIEEIYSELVEYNQLAEEIISQHEIMKSFCPDTLNTIRINTFFDVHGVVHILTASGRFGRMGNAVDNFHAGGFSVTINPETGVILSDGLNRVHERSEFHPDTGKKFKGFQYPFWGRLRKTVIKMAKIVPSMRHVGWDVAINAKGEIDLVEANEAPATDVQQAPDSVGRLYLYTPLIKELEDYQRMEFDFLGWRVNRTRNFNTFYEAEANHREQTIPAVMKKIIPECKSLMDLGCRNLTAKKFCPEGVEYFPIDYKKFADEILICDFNRGKFPNLTADTCLLAMTAEYVVPLPSFLKKVCSAAQKQILMVCRPFDREKSQRSRRQNNLLTDFTEKFLIQTLQQNNFSLQSAEPFSPNSSFILYDFRKNI